jgi:hypothetical protein
MFAVILVPKTLYRHRVLREEEAGASTSKGLPPRPRRTLPRGLACRLRAPISTREDEAQFMTEVEILPARMSSADFHELRRAVGLIEKNSLAARLTRALGGQVEALGRALPSAARGAVAFATERALKLALRVAVRTLGADRGASASSDRMHKVAAAASGAFGGAFGIAALAVELPVSTTILLRSIADIARSEGEDLSEPENRLACLEVFALGGTRSDEAGVESGYLAARAMLARSVGESARFFLRSGLAGEMAPAVVRLLSQVSARFGIAVSEKLAAQAVPILGAVGGAAINAAFADHFQALARGHFIVRRLERAYGPDFVHEAYRRLAAER